jgi:hypothetical protein
MNRLALALVILTISLTIFALIFTTGEAVAKNHQDNSSTSTRTKHQAIQPEKAISQKVYRQGKLTIKLHTDSHGIDSVGVYCDQKLILRKSLTSDYKDSDFMWLAFPCVSKRTRHIHTFDGKLDDFISTNAKLASSPFVDFDGDGVPELIVAHNFGNAATIYNIYSLQRQGKELAKISATRSEAQFIDIGHDGICEVISSDPTFFGWKTSNASSPMPLVILRLNHKRFELATALMRSKPPTQSRQQEILKAWSKTCKQNLVTSNLPCEKLKSDQSNFTLAPIIWGDMLKLIYSGNSELAFSLLDKFWSPASYAINLEENDNCTAIRTSKDQFVKMFLQQLARSKYLDKIKQLNKGDVRIRNL